MEPAARLTQLETELISVRQELGTLAAQYNPKASCNQNSDAMNKLIHRMRHLYTNINQERQKLSQIQTSVLGTGNDPKIHNQTSERDVEAVPES